MPQFGTQVAFVANYDKGYPGDALRWAGRACQSEVLSKGRIRNESMVLGMRGEPEDARGGEWSQHVRHSNGSGRRRRESMSTEPKRQKDEECVRGDSRFYL